LRQHYERISVEGQEYDPYTTMLAKKKWTLHSHDDDGENDDDGDDGNDDDDGFWWCRR
jgi:hypothetical protein